MSKKMNVLFIITDGQRADHLGCAGNPDVKTPNLDQLASRGIRFTNAYCANPFCMPNRSTIITGKYPSIHGVRSNGINLNPKIPTFIESIRDSGYNTFAIGKMHLNWYGNPYSRKDKSTEMLIPFLYKEENEKIEISNYYGFEEVHLTIGHGDAVGGHYLDWLKKRSNKHFHKTKQRVLKFTQKLNSESPLPEDLHPTSYITEETISFLKKHSEEKSSDTPFFIYTSFPDPHHPACPSKKFKEMYESENIEIPPTLNDVDELYNHPVLKPYIDIYKMNWLRKTNEEELRNFLAHTYGTISQIDDGIGKILSALKSFGLENETLIIFTSDHGDLMGDHGVLFQGMAHYQGYIKVPLIIKSPKLIKEGIISSSLTSSIDLPITILNLLGIKSKDHPPGMQGYDLIPILKNPQIEVRDHCIIEEDQDPQKDSHKLPPIRIRTMITERYRITVYQGHEEFGDLYNLKNDPHEKHNLWYDESSKKIKNKLITKLLHELINIQDRFPKRQARA